MIYLHRVISVLSGGWQQPKLQQPSVPAWHPWCTKVFLPRRGLQPGARGIAHPAAREEKYLFALLSIVSGGLPCCVCKKMGSDPLWAGRLLRAPHPPHLRCSSASLLRQGPI